MFSIEVNDNYNNELNNSSNDVKFNIEKNYSGARMDIPNGNSFIISRHNNDCFIIGINNTENKMYSWHYINRTVQQAIDEIKSKSKKGNINLYKIEYYE